MNAKVHVRNDDCMSMMEVVETGKKRCYIYFVTSCKMPGWMKHRLESRLPGEISITSDLQMTPPLWQKVKRN